MGKRKNSVQMSSHMTEISKRQVSLMMIWGVLRHELRQHAFSMIMPVFICGFLIFLNGCIFFVGNFLDTNLATLDLQWQFLVWISILLLPALAMRSFEGYDRAGSIDLLLSLPLVGSDFIIGKWLSGVVILLAVVILTFPMVLTIANLGRPDWGVVLSGYFAAVLLLSSLYAVAMMAAAICKEKVSAFLLGIALVLGLLVCDIERSMLMFLPDQLAALIGYTYLLSPKYWFQEIASGDITLAAIFYFLFLSILSLGIATWQFSMLRRPSDNKIFVVAASLTVFFAGVCSISVFLVFFSSLDVGFDASAQREFTMNEQTINILHDAPKTTKIQFFFNQSLAEVPPIIRQHRDRVERLLRRIEKLGKGRIKIDLIALSEDTEMAELAQINGIAAVPMSSGDTLFLGALFSAGERQLVVNYFDYKRASLLEYDLVQKISNLSREKTPQIGIVSSFLKPTNVGEPHPSFSILEELKSQYDVTIIPYFAEALPIDLDVLIVIDTPVLRQGMLIAIDKHIASGLGALLLVDPYQRMNNSNASLAIKESKDGKINTLGDLLSHYGLNMSRNKIVGDDLNPSLVRSISGKAYPYPYWLQLGSTNISSDHIVSSLLKQLLFAEVGHFEIAPDNSLFHPIVFTSSQTAELDKREIKKRKAEYLAANFEPATHPPRNLVVYVNGAIEPAFNDDSAPGSGKKVSFFAVSDTDWIYNGFSVTEMQVGGATSAKPINDNFSLFLNIVEYLSGDDRLLAIRSRGSPIRSFERVEKMLVEAGRNYRQQEAEYLAKISNAESSIREVMDLTGVKLRDQLPDDLREQVMQLQGLAYPLKKELRALRQQMREDVNVLFRDIVIFNIVTSPILVIGLLIFLRWQRNRQSRQSKSNAYP